MSVHTGRTLTDAIIDVLEGDGLLIGDAVAPAGVGWQGAAGQSTFKGYVVVYPMAGGMVSGSIEAPDDDGEALYQITSLGATRQQCEYIADRVRAAVLAGPYTQANRKVIRVTVDMLGGASRDDDVQPPVFYSPDRYRFMTSPL